MRTRKRLRITPLLFDLMRFTRKERRGSERLRSGDVSVEVSSFVY